MRKEGYWQRNKTNHKNKFNTMNGIFIVLLPLFCIIFFALGYLSSELDAELKRDKFL